MSLSAITLGIKFVAYSSIHFIKDVNDVLLGRKRGFNIYVKCKLPKNVINLMLNCKIAGNYINKVIKNNFLNVL